ncbi:MAG: protein kinase [Prevotella sp.]|nr:protein kinase [Prevotella sp.]
MDDNNITIRMAGGNPGNTEPIINTDTTLRPASDTSGKTSTNDASPSLFYLKDECYQLVDTLSQSSGEAQVFLVRKEGDNQDRVLKVYYPNFNVDKRLSQVVANFQFEMIVKLFDYGKTYIDGKHRYYELMEHLQGGTLQDYDLKGDLVQFRRIALQAAAALAYCHHHGLLHKDIKPSNFFFRNADHQQLVLGDFGISALREENANTYHTTQARTPIYAAPEMYADVIDGKVEITEAADYYSLGITLFSLWLGESPMSSNERVMMRQKSEGRLPRMAELPDRVRALVQGLTAVNPHNRWGYDQVERWFQGEDVPVDLTSPFLRYKSFVVDPEENLVADNVEELVPMLASHEQVGINYLYNGRIVAWLESSGNTKMSELIKDIITNRYPVDKKAGFMSALYTMNPAFPYTDLQGNSCSDVHSVALALLAQQPQYGICLQRPNDPLFLWLETHVECDINRLRSYFTPDADSRVAVLKLVYEIDPEVPFLARHPSSTVKEISHAYGYCNLSDDDWQALCDGRLLSWMYSHEDMMACESLRILTQHKPYSVQLAYKVLYNLDREAAYDLREANTPELVGQLLGNELMLAQHLSDTEFAEQMRDYTDPDGRFFCYAQLHGWIALMSEATRCFNLSSAENRDRLSAYDLRTALYRFCRILGAVPTYQLPNGVVLTDCAKLDLGQAASLKTELRNGSLAQWMSVFYHEDPTQDFQEEYSYERTLEAWIMAVGSIDSQQIYYRRFTKACEDTKERVAEVRRQWENSRAKGRLWRSVFYALSGLWILLVLVVGISGRSYLFDHTFMAIALPLGGMSAVIVGVHAYFKGIGPMLSTIIGLVGAVTSYIPILLMQAVQNSQPSLLNFVVVAITLVYMLVCHLTAFKEKHITESDDIRELFKADDVKSSLLEPLYYTFKTRSQRYKGTKFGMLDELSDHVKSLSGESVMHYVLWSMMVLVLVLEFCIFSGKLLDAPLP